MELVTFVPMIVCLYAIYRWGTCTALLYVVLPTLLLLPTYFYITLRPIPAINFIDAALIPLGFAMIFLDVLRWKFSRTDIWMFLFVLSAGITPFQNGATTDAAFAWFAAVVGGLIPYMAGKLLIEQTGSRVKVARIFVVLVGGQAVVSSFEYFFRRNPYAMFWNHFYPSQYSTWYTQVRWGFGRVAGPYSQSELAGQIVFTAWLLALWLGRYNLQELSLPRAPELPLRRGKWWIWGLFLALFMTQARGPWLGAALGLAVAAIGRARRPGLRALTVVACIVLIGLPAYTLGKDYLAGPRKNYGSEKETAQYRAELVSNYTPLAIKGGKWGWGSKFPTIGGQDSIDNEYLYAWISQGYIGALALILMLLEACSRLVLQGMRAKTVRDLHFYCTMLGIIVAIAFTISTVFLGSQTYELFFLLIGWVQAIKAPRAKVRVVLNDEVYRGSEEQSLARIYS